MAVTEELCGEYFWVSLGEEAYLHAGPLLRVEELDGAVEAVRGHQLCVHGMHGHRVDVVLARRELHRRGSALRAAPDLHHPVSASGDDLVRQRVPLHVPDESVVATQRLRLVGHVAPPVQRVPRGDHHRLLRQRREALHRALDTPLRVGEHGGKRTSVDVLQQGRHAGHRGGGEGLRELVAVGLLQQGHESVRGELEMRAAGRDDRLLQDHALVEELARERGREDLARLLHPRPVLEVRGALHALHG